MPTFAKTKEALAKLTPEDGLYLLPYMAMQADGRPWEGDEADPFGPPHRARQPFDGPELGACR